MAWAIVDMIFASIVEGHIYLIRSESVGALESIFGLVRKEKDNKSNKVL